MTTLTEKQASNFAMALDILEKRIAESKGRMVALSAKLLTSPCSALEWSADDFVHAARIQVYGDVVKAARNPEGKATLFTLLTYCQKQGLRAAMYPQRSTSPCSNLMDQAKGTAWAEAHEWLEGCV